MWLQDCMTSQYQSQGSELYLLLFVLSPKAPSNFGEIGLQVGEITPEVTRERNSHVQFGERDSPIPLIGLSRDTPLNLLQGTLNYPGAAQNIENPFK